MLRRGHHTIAEGDTVIVFFGYAQPTKPLVIKGGDTLMVKEGIWPHELFVGAKYGTRVYGKHRAKKDEATQPRPFVTVLRNTPELWTLSQPHRTQIIYATDIALICQYLKLRPGSTVAEAGTGSGSLTHTLARAVAPSGTVFTYDFHKARVAAAKEEFRQHGLSEVIVSQWRDVCSNASSSPEVATATEPSSTTESGDQQPEQPPSGYGLPPNSIDAIFLDVPSPWLAIENIMSVLKRGGVVCSFSPCIEQTQRFCEGVRSAEERAEAAVAHSPAKGNNSNSDDGQVNKKYAFRDVHTVECLSKEYIPVHPPSQREKRLREIFGAPSTSSSANGTNSWPLHYKPQSVGKGHTAFLSFATRNVV